VSGRPSSAATVITVAVSAVMRRLRELLPAVEWLVRTTTSPTRKPTVINDPVLPTMVVVVVVMEVAPPPVASVSIRTVAQVPRKNAS
jgi:hypothetical protein